MLLLLSTKCKLDNFSQSLQDDLTEENLKKTFEFEIDLIPFPGLSKIIFKDFTKYLFIVISNVIVISCVN